MKSHIKHSLFTVLLAVSGWVWAQTGNQGIITADAVRVRSEPGLEAAIKGYLYKRMIVPILDTKNLEGSEPRIWHKTETEDFEGWFSGEYLSFEIPEGQIDTYAYSGDMKWFYHGLVYDELSHCCDFRKVSVDSYSIDQYRGLISEIEKSEGNVSWEVVSALGASIFKHLKDNPNDPRYIYLKKKIFSEPFSYKLLTGIGFNISISLPDMPLLHDKKFALRVLGKNGYAFTLFPAEIRTDRELVMKMAHRPGIFIPKELNDDYELVMKIVKRDGRELRSASERLRADKSIIEAAVNEDIHSIQYAINPEREMVLRIVSDMDFRMPYIPKEYRGDREIVKAMLIKGRGIAFGDFHDDDEIAHLAVSKDGRFIQYVSERLKADRKIIYAALANTELNFRDQVKTTLNLLRPNMQDMAAGVQIIWENRSKSKSVAGKIGTETYTWQAVPEDLWSNAEFVLEIALRWNKYEDCSFLGYVRSIDAEKAASMKRRISEINPACSDTRNLSETR